jgi:hypothetical protein
LTNFKFLLSKLFSLKNHYTNNFKKTLVPANLVDLQTNKLNTIIHDSKFSTNPLSLSSYKSPFFKTLLLEGNVSLYLISSLPTQFVYNINFFYFLQNNLKLSLVYLLDIWKRTIGDGFIYLRGLFIIFFIDACLTDDEPIWEPVEWSLVQSWIMFIFLFAWISENLISSRYGSYTGRDKRVWIAWYKTFWLVEAYYIISLGAACLWVMVPFYFEVTYSTSFLVSWWNWYSRVFFFKFISLYTVILFIAYFLQINVRYANWRKSFVLIILINFFLSYLIYIHFFMSFFGYFTDANWYHKTRLVDYVQLSHEPNKWSWGTSKRDHFSYHRSSTVFWFKNDGPFASSFLFINLLFLISLFLLYFYWITLIRRVYATQEITYTYTTYCISGLKQFFYLFLFLFIFILFSFMFNYWRLPVEFYWILNTNSWFTNFTSILSDYWTLIKTIF